MQAFLFTLLLGAAAAASANLKIINGQNCSPHSQPWQVLLTFNGYRWCGGSLINDQWIVSAAHCYHPSSILVAHLGEHNLSHSEGTEQRIQVVKAIVHPSFNYRNFNNDILLLKLAWPATFDQYVRPIPLPSQCATAGTQCSTSGWGRLMINGGELPEVLQCLNQPILPDADCAKAYPLYFTDNMFCSGYWEGGQGTCQGDSGGPVVCNGELQGITSWGYHCAMKDHPGVFVKVCNYYNWIQTVMDEN
ncbi:trypsin-like [Carcharodon carcharias]|uniref:trypsin-like n=1 Tax=Carcharodon carcharias TaxID=13397 RepID=UPI001B7E8F8A|nr:trypsin-like [Carcharodon carcharias]